MHIAFRVDSSTIIGHGHVMRCLTLAHAITCAPKQFEITISFITKENQGNINHLISNAGFQLILIAIGNNTIKQENSDTWLGCTPEQDALQTIASIKKLSPIDLLIVDHYAIAKSWHQLVKPYYQKLMVIDDLANRLLDCDFLLDQTLNRNKEHYQSLVPEHCSLLLGQDFMLLRDEFAALKAQAKIRRKRHITQQSTLQGIQLTQANILITMGGSDPDNLSELALLAIKKLRVDFPNISATLVLSSQSKHIKTLQQQQKYFPWCKLVIDTQTMAKLMLNADIAIGASGATSWERCCLGLPCLTIINAENQQFVAKNLALANASINLGWYQQVSIDAITEQLHALLKNQKIYVAMVESCFSTCDGQGAARVAKALITAENYIEEKNITKNHIVLLPATIEDKQLTFDWQLEKNIRQYFKQPTIPTWQEHSQWFAQNLANLTSSLYIILNKGIPSGTLRLDKIKPNQYDVSILIATKEQGKGIALKVLKKLPLLKENSQFFADIHQDNISSYHVFKQAGFIRLTPQSQSSKQCTEQNKVMRFIKETTGDYPQ